MHFKSKLRRNGCRENNLHMKFSTLNVDFSSPRPDPGGSKRPAQVSVKEGYHCKK